MLFSSEVFLLIMAVEAFALCVMTTWNLQITCFHHALSLIIFGNYCTIGLVSLSPYLLFRSIITLLTLV
ncbi:hypothetical protein Lalb_Chr23g0266681 [Lupinus albus]|uniref:Uncharacterized protein n=1 Tax=Lupinus albus TaxID=3870 RepID=A0A6A4MTS9_LUPAL|nr:hypothetical protein Lalb_Chr23g0266681 [Lupinus albus]